MEFRILGPLEVWEASRPIPLGGAKQRALLAILVLEANRVVSTDRLIELLWGNEPPETVGNTLQVCVSQLRKILEPTHQRGTPYAVLVSQPPGYAVHATSDQIDYLRFQLLVSEARERGIKADPKAAADLLRQALGLWRGPPLADFATERFALAEAKRLDEMRLGAVEDRIEADLALGRHVQLVGELEALVSEHPLRERLRAQLMLALYRAGRQAEASEVFHKTRAVLVDELGMEPGAELQKLLKAILNQDPALDLTPRPEALLPPRLTNLPLALTSFVGRTSELAEVTSLCSRSRMVTLTGAGGIGKTRLAIKVASELAASFRDGTWLVEFAPLNDPGLVPQTVAAVLGVREQPGVPMTDSLIRYLESRQLLLVLDNCEHLIGASAKLVDGLLRNCPDLRALATSREALGIDGESTWRVPSLAVPDRNRPEAPELLTHYGAVELFADRAVTALGSFELTDNSWPLVVQVCERLDGIPLAIELAVGKLRALSLAQVASRLNDRFHLLTGGNRTALPRQQTLQATIDWSYDLLPAAQQAVLRRLSVFAGGLDLEAAEAVCWDAPRQSAEVLGALTGLIDKSLLLMSTRNGEARYQLLETIGQYATIKLEAAGELEEARRRHSEWFLSFAERAQPELRGPNQLRWFERLEAEHDNLRAAFEWSMEQDSTDGALRLASAMGFFWMFQGHIAEGREWLERAIGKGSTGSRALQAVATAWAAQLAGDQYDYQMAVALAERSLRLFRELADDWGMGFCSLILGNQHLGQDELEAASQLFEESYIHFRQSGRLPDIAKSLDRLGFVSWVKGDYENAARLLGESRDLSNTVGNRWYVATTTVNLSQVALSQGRFVLAGELLGEALPLLTELKDVYHASVALHHQAVIARCDKDYPRALLLLEQSAAPLRELGDPLFLNYCMGERGIVVWLQGNLNEALQLLRQSAAVSLQMRDKANLAKWIEALAGACGDGGELLTAATLSGAAEALREEIGAPLEPYEHADYSRRLETLRSSLGRAQFEKAWGVGRALPLEDLLPLVPEWLEAVDPAKQHVETERRQGRNPAR
jgi:predicted ATPase/DNA-binding SARP family transcriptional activator